MFRKPARNAVYRDLAQALVTVDLDRLILAAPQLYSIQVRPCVPKFRLGILMVKAVENRLQ